MLFDLRGRGRRRTVQVIYLSLAILMGGGLVLFGIGGSVSGGLFDAFNENSGGGDVTASAEKSVTTAAAATEANPEDAAAWARLVRARFQLAQLEEGNVNEDTSAFTAKGRRALVPVEQAWDRYVALDPDPPDDGVAGLMVQAFSSAGLDKPEKAVRAMEMVIASRDESPNLYSQLAVLAYQAGQDRKGDLAADKAVSLAPEAERKLLRENLDNAKAQSVADQASEAATTPSPAATGTTSTTG